MAYILPRAFIVLVAWAITCGLIKNVWSPVDPMIFYLVGGSWAFAGLLGFGYLHKLRAETNHGPGPLQG
jgi:hypothetical protein